MKFDTNKQIGNSSLGIAIAYFVGQGFTVSIPLNDTQDYDLVVDMNNKLYRVQVKGTKCRTSYNVFQANLRSLGGTKGYVYKTLKDTDIDLVFIVTAELNAYLIPKSIITNSNSINLGDKYNEYRL